MPEETFLQRLSNPHQSTRHIMPKVRRLKLSHHILKLYMHIPSLKIGSPFVDGGPDED